MSEARVEILVHSAAPTSKSEDDRIRAQALSILGFMPGERTHIASLAFAKKRERVSSAPKLEEETLPTLADGGSHEELLEKSVKSSIDGQYMIPSVLSPFIDYGGGISPLLTTRSTQGDIVENAGSTESPRPLTPAQDGTESDSSYATSRFDSWESPPASIPDSQPSLPSDPFAVPAARAEEGYIDETEATVFPTLTGVSFCYNPPPTVSTLAPLSPRPESSLATSDYSLSSLHSNYVLPSVQNNNNPRSPPLRILLAAGGAYELISPPPDTNSSPVLITRQLREMTEVGDLLVGKYQKLKRAQTRELRKWERGHWRVDMRAWEDPNKKVNFWNILKDNVEHGRLGPVNVFLDEETGDVVKVYCHGGMVEHLWCALFVMSSRNSRSATWIDAGDNKIIVF